MKTNKKNNELDTKNIDEVAVYAMLNCENQEQYEAFWKEYDQTGKISIFV